jgi:hypothetical protein
MKVRLKPDATYVDSSECSHKLHVNPVWIDKVHLSRPAVVVRLDAALA